MLQALASDLFVSAHAVGSGGLAVTLAEACLIGGHGADCQLPRGRGRLDERLFGEAPGRVVVSLDPERSGELDGLGVPWRLIGRVTEKAELRLGSVGPFDLKVPWEEAIARWYA